MQQPTATLFTATLGGLKVCAYPPNADLLPAYLGIEVDTKASVHRFSADTAAALGAALMAAAAAARQHLADTQRINAPAAIPDRMAQEFGLCAGATPEAPKTGAANDTGYRSVPLLSEWPAEAAAVAQHYQLDATNGGW